MCRCSCHLSKPNQRLQKLIHSLSNESSHRHAADEPLARKRESQDITAASKQSIHQQQTEEQLQELRMLVDLLPSHLRDSLLARPDISKVKLCTRVFVSQGRCYNALILWRCKEGGLVLYLANCYKLSKQDTSINQTLPGVNPYQYLRILPQL